MQWVGGVRCLGLFPKKSRLFFTPSLSGNGGYPPPLNGQNPLISFLRVLLTNKCGESRYLSIFGAFLHAQWFNALVDIDQNVLKQICHVSRFTLILCVQLLRARPKLRNPFFEPKIKNYAKNIENLPIG